MTDSVPDLFYKEFCLAENQLKIFDRFLDLFNTIPCLRKEITSYHSNISTGLFLLRFLNETDPSRLIRLLWHKPDQEEKIRAHLAKVGLTPANMNKFLLKERYFSLEIGMSLFSVPLTLDEDFIGLCCKFGWSFKKVEEEYLIDITKLENAVKVVYEAYTSKALTCSFSSVYVTNLEYLIHKGLPIPEELPFAKEAKLAAPDDGTLQLLLMILDYALNRVGILKISARTR